MCKSKRIKSEQTTLAKIQLGEKGGKKEEKPEEKLEQTMQLNFRGATEWHLKDLPGRTLNMLGVMGMPNTEYWSCSEGTL